VRVSHRGIPKRARVSARRGSARRGSARRGSARRGSSRGITTAAQTLLPNFPGRTEYGEQGHSALTQI
jgi:hypothetical protein